MMKNMPAFWEKKTYIATMAGSNCISGADVSEIPSGKDLQKVYGVFKAECLEKTVSQASRATLLFTHFYWHT